MRSLGRDDGVYAMAPSWSCLFFIFYPPPKKTLNYIFHIYTYRCDLDPLRFLQCHNICFRCFTTPSHGCVPCKWWSASEWRPPHQPEGFFRVIPWHAWISGIAFFSSWGDVHAKYHKVMSFCNTVFNSQGFFSNSARIIISRYQNHQARQLEALCQEHLLEGNA